MVVLNLFGKIEKTLISDKLKLYISNLPKEDHNNWQDGLVDEMNDYFQAKQVEKERFGCSPRNDVTSFFTCVFPDHSDKVSLSEESMLRMIASNMICLFFDYDYDDMPLGDWTTNCFDGRFCEGDYIEKIVRFINFVPLPYTDNLMSTDNHDLVPQWIYSSNYDKIDESFQLLWVRNNMKSSVRSLVEWGKAFDRFLSSENDYYKLNYLFDSIFEDDKYNKHHFFRSYSLCEMLLYKPDEEIDNALSLFLSNPDSELRNKEASLLRQIRNKIAHGDFIGFNKKAEEYAQKILDPYFWFDYSEYSRQNWVIGNICCEIDDALKRVLSSLFFSTETNKMETKN